jgi:hypothetical protein
MDMIGGDSDDSEPPPSPSGLRRGSNSDPGSESDDAAAAWPWNDYSTKRAAHFVEQAGLSGKQTTLLSALLLDPKFNAGDVCGGSNITKKRLFEPVQQLPQTVRHGFRFYAVLMYMHACICLLSTAHARAKPHV